MRNLISQFVTTASNSPKAVLSVSAVTAGTGVAEAFNWISLSVGLIGIAAGAAVSIILGYTRWKQHKSIMVQNQLKEKLLLLDLEDRKKRNGKRTRRNDHET